MRHDVLGTARTTAGQGGPPAAVAVAAAGERHDLVVRFHLPRAVRVGYVVSCPGEQREGVVGESWEQYRERRLRELRAERRRQVDAVGSIVGAAVGSAGAGARVETPAAEGEVEAEVDGEAAGRAVADSAIADVELAPNDVGAQNHQRNFLLHPAEPGTCTVALQPEDDGASIDGVTADLTVTHVVDVRRERAEARAAANHAAVEVRAEISAGLVARGADPLKRQREREAAARAEAERQRKLREAEARAEAERRREREARLRVEAELRAERERERREAEAERRREREARLRVEAELRAERERKRRERELRVEAELRQRLDLALEVRGRIVADLIASGCDPHKRRREREAAARAEAERLRKQRERERREYEARLRIEAERRREREAAARAEAERRREQRERERLAYEAELRAEAELRERRARADRVAIDVRASLVADLIAAGADPDYRRKRNEAELRAFEERSALEHAAQLELEARIRAQTEGALRARAQIKLALIEAGAVDRPPRPAPPVEQRPMRPAPAAVWVSGYYAWSGISWEWQSGYWSDPPEQNAVWVPPVELVIEGAAVLRPGGWRDKKTGKKVRVRDHRRK